MKEIHHCKFSLFLLEKKSNNPHYYFEDCFEFIETFDNLEDAKIVQKEYKQKSIILPSY